GQSTILTWLSWPHTGRRIRTLRRCRKERRGLLSTRRSGSSLSLYRPYRGMPFSESVPRIGMITAIILSLTAPFTSSTRIRLTLVGRCLRGRSRFARGKRLTTRLSVGKRRRRNVNKVKLYWDKVIVRI